MPPSPAEGVGLECCAQDVPQSVTISGVGDFSATEDIIALRAPNCTSPEYTNVALSGSGTSRSALHRSLREGLGLQIVCTRLPRMRRVVWTLIGHKSGPTGAWGGLAQLGLTHTETRRDMWWTT